MIELALIFGLISAVILPSLIVGLIHERGFQEGRDAGYAKGYDDGRAQEGNWWIRAEEEVRGVREKIREEEAER